MSQYDMDIIYIRGEDNTVADALSRVVVPNAFPEEQTDLWSSSCAVLSIEATNKSSVTLNSVMNKTAFANASPTSA
jgi:hypothetical protein